MKISIDQDRCVAAGQCAASAPEVFDQRDEDGIVVLLAPVPREEAEDGARAAAELCPAQAIHLQA